MNLIVASEEAGFVENNWVGCELAIGDAGRFPCAGVYAVVQASGIVRSGDRVSLM